jgi:hypothetical protein
VPGATLVNFKIRQAWNRVKIARLVITKATRASRIALGSFQGGIKMKKVRLHVKSVMRTRHQPIANVTLRVVLAVRAGQHHQEA